MKITHFVLLFTILLVLVSIQAIQNSEAQSMIQMCKMMNGPPKDVIIIPASSQLVKTGREATLTILIKDKVGSPVLGVRVLVMIERGPPMSTMEMIGPMILAEEIGNGKYQISFTPDSEGIYTLHSHVIQQGRSMMAMMNNHMDLGVIAR
ncbi:MAG: hypothetical protein QXE84_06480 [Candidatus Nitrosotenuis sp.]